KRGLHQLFERGDKRRKIKISRNDRNEQKERVLRYVAWRFHKAEPAELSNSLRDREQNLNNVLKKKIEWLEEEPPKNAQALLEEFVDDGVLVRVGRDTYRFVLRSFHEYCLAGWITQEAEFSKDEAAFQRVILGNAEAWDREDDWNDLRPLTEDNWQDVWPLVAGQLDDGKMGADIWRLPRIFMQERASFNDVVLPTCVSELPDCSEKTQYKKGLVADLDDPDLAVRYRASRHLAVIADESCRDALICRLNAKEPDFEDERETRRRAHETEDDYSERMYELSLDETFGTYPGQARYGPEFTERETWEHGLADIASALGEIGDPESRDSLVKILRHRLYPTNVEEAAVAALGHIGDDDARDTLVSILQSPKALLQVRLRAAEALGQVTDESSILGLLQTLDDPRTEPELWATSAVAIVAASEGRVIEQVLELLCKVTSTNTIIVHKLAEVGHKHWASNFARDLLIHCLESPVVTKRIQEKCAEELAWFYKDHAVIKSLLQCVKSTDISIEVRQQCVNSLCDMAWSRPRNVNNSIVDHIFKLLDDENLTPEVRERCACTLASEYPMRWKEKFHDGRSWSEHDLSQLFIDRLLDDTVPSAVRMWCLRRVYSEWCDSSLDSDVRQKGRDILIRVLRDQNAREELRSECATYLANYSRDFDDGASGDALILIRDDPRSTPDLQIHIWDLLNELR
ncbi:HEAT repeat domain-containing protein, partial [Rubripirellula sp.]